MRLAFLPLLSFIHTGDASLFGQSGESTGPIIRLPLPHHAVSLQPQGKEHVQKCTMSEQAASATMTARVRDGSKDLQGAESFRPFDSTFRLTRASRLNHKQELCVSLRAL